MIGIVFCYGLLLLTFSLTSQTNVLPLGQDKCFDDWCASVIKINKLDSANANIYAVTLKVSNHARGRAQKPDHPEIYVIDNLGNIYLESVGDKSDYQKQYGVQRSIESRIDAQTSYETTMIFSIPKDRKGSVVITEGGFPTPLIIGDEGSFLHKKSITPLD